MMGAFATITILKATKASRQATAYQSARQIFRQSGVVVAYHKRNLPRIVQERTALGGLLLGIRR